jgi:hypothetical protein
MALPQLTPEQRQAALKKAAEVRSKRAALRNDIKSGKKSIAAVLKNAEDPIVGKFKVASLLQAVPGFGKAKTEKLMEELNISETRRVQGLGSRQLADLIERLS